MTDNPLVRLPRYAPMIATQVSRPFHRDGWIYEEKVDGWRMLAYRDGKMVRLESRNGVDHTKRFPDLTAAVAALPGGAVVFDGEVAVFDTAFRSRFEWLREPDPVAIATPPLLIVFDLLYLAGRDQTPNPLRDRRARLEGLLAGQERVLPVRRLAVNGLEAWDQVLRSGFEGYVAKDEASPYVGGVTRSWLKVKVPGWTDPDDRWKRVRLGERL